MTSRSPRTRRARKQSVVVAVAVVWDGVAPEVVVADGDGAGDSKLGLQVEV